MPRSLTRELLLGFIVCALSLGRAALSQQPSASTFQCPVSRPNQGRDGFANDSLRVSLWTDSKIVFRPGGPGFVLPDGSLGMKYPWLQYVRGSLSISGRRLDASEEPLRYQMSDLVMNPGVRPGTLIFSTPGCWEITGRIGDASLTFVTLIEKIGDGPDWKIDEPPNVRSSRTFE
jgi:hypothetical protein